MNNKGFTLIEILIALAVFAILATITSSTLYYAFDTRARVNEQSKRLDSLQLAVSLLQQDITQIIDRPIRGNEMRLISAFIGRSKYVEFTRDGDVNPEGMEKRSTLKRIAYLCQNNTLKRRTWEHLDSPQHNKYWDKNLLEQLTDCHFEYLNQTLQLFPEWHQDALTQNQNKEPLPKAIQVNLSFKDQGTINLLFTIPEALYVNE
jgi:general secretion pathway protein J